MNKECRCCATLFSDKVLAFKDITVCEFCNSPLYDSNGGFTDGEFDWIVNYPCPYEKELYLRYVQNNPENQEKFKMKMDNFTNTVENFSADIFYKEMMSLGTPNEFRSYKRNESSQPKCPHCGSTNIQLLRKKWSVLTGFLTNKVERYCVNCGKKID